MVNDNNVDSYVRGSLTKGIQSANSLIDTGKVLENVDRSENEISNRNLTTALKGANLAFKIIDTNVRHSQGIDARKELAELDQKLYSDLNYGEVDLTNKEKMLEMKKSYDSSIDALQQKYFFADNEPFNALKTKMNQDILKSSVRASHKKLVSSSLVSVKSQNLTLDKYMNFLGSAQGTKSLEVLHNNYDEASVAKIMNSEFKNASMNSAYDLHQDIDFITKNMRNQGLSENDIKQVISVRDNAVKTQSKISITSINGSDVRTKAFIESFDKSALGFDGVYNLDKGASKTQEEIIKSNMTDAEKKQHLEMLQQYVALSRKKIASSGMLGFITQKNLVLSSGFNVISPLNKAQSRKDVLEKYDPEGKSTFLLPSEKNRLDGNDLSLRPFLNNLTETYLGDNTTSEAFIKQNKLLDEIGKSKSLLGLYYDSDKSNAYIKEVHKFLAEHKDIDFEQDINDAVKFAENPLTQFNPTGLLSAPSTEEIKMSIEKERTHNVSGISDLMKRDVNFKRLLYRSYIDSRMSNPNNKSRPDIGDLLKYSGINVINYSTSIFGSSTTWVKSTNVRTHAPIHILSDVLEERGARAYGTFKDENVNPYFMKSLYSNAKIDTKDGVHFSILDKAGHPFMDKDNKTIVLTAHELGMN